MTLFRYSLLFTFLVSFNLKSQEYPQNYFRSPLDIPLVLSGNFGELRSNHFHAGLDIKTQGVEGKKVYAVADGFVSRIKVSPYGYGNAIYITHPNGYTSVYGHLKKYSDRITEYVKAEQYKKESFAIQLFPPPFKFQVKKGELIAYSGNTGGSGGPHLHFEIRDTKSEHTINPLFFGFDIKDAIKPQVLSIALYPLDKDASVNGANKMKEFTAVGSNGYYKLKYDNPILVNGKIGVGIMAVDRMDFTSNKYGIYKISLEFDDDLIFEQEIDEFAFHEGRYINAHIDYPSYAKYRRRYQRSYVLAGNKLRFYNEVKNSGIVEFNDKEKHQFTYTLLDLNGNKSKLDFEVQANSDIIAKSESTIGQKKIRFFPHTEENTFLEDEILLKLPRGVLYEDIYFEYRVEEKNNKTISDIYWLHNPYTPLHSYTHLSIKGIDVPLRLRDKALIVSTTDGNSFYAEGGNWNGENISVRTRSFGGYAIAIDTINPKIDPINIYPGAKMNSKWSITIKISDNLSGIENYNGTIDDKWILMEYDAKNDLLTYYFDDLISSGKHHFKLVVTDKVGNKTEYQAEFTR